MHRISLGVHGVSNRENSYNNNIKNILFENVKKEILFYEIRTQN